jgi:hypothetical protein
MGSICDKKESDLLLMSKNCFFTDCYLYLLIINNCAAVLWQIVGETLL